jgi:hypothetical protein
MTAAGTLLAATAAGAQSPYAKPTAPAPAVAQGPAIELPPPAPAPQPPGEVLPPPHSVPAPEPAAGPAHVPEGPPAPEPAAGPAAPGEPVRGGKRYPLQECFLGFPEEFEAPPLGLSVNLQIQTQVANGVAAGMVLYRYDFVGCTAALNLKGRDRLAKIAALLPHNFFPLVIERTPEAPELAEARRVAVLAELAHGPFPVPPERVVIGPPLAHGLAGVEAVLINENLMRQTAAQGALGGLGFGATGGAAGPGFGATGRTPAGTIGPGPAGP